MIKNYFHKSSSLRMIPVLLLTFHSVYLSTSSALLNLQETHFFKARHQTNTGNFRITVLLHQLQHVTPMMCCSLCVTALSPGRHKPHSRSKREAVMHHSCILSGRTTPTQDAFDPSTNKNPHMRQTFDTASNSNSHREAYRK